jgi:hypothetical protein
MNIDFETTCRANAANRLHMYYGFTLKEAGEEITRASKMDFKEYMTYSREGLKTKPLTRDGRKAVWDWLKGVN